MPPPPPRSTATTIPIFNPSSSSPKPNLRRLSSRHPNPNRVSAIATSIFFLFLSSFFWISLITHHSSSPPAAISDSISISSPPPPPSSLSLSSPLSLNHLIFGIAASSHLLPFRQHIIQLWWRPHSMRGHLWLDNKFQPNSSTSSSLPPIKISRDISRFRYTNPTGHPSGLRIARIISESFWLNHNDARWFVLCDDDTIISPDNLLDVLSKYDWREMVYVGGSSESHSANTYFSHEMAFGGGGVAVSYPLAKAIAEMEDGCLERYPKLYGSDDRLHACISELGVPLSREHGFHQWDIRGNAHWLLAAHPIAPFVSIHHVEAVDPLFPGLNTLESLNLFSKAMTTEPKSFLQRAICYNSPQTLTFSVSLGYAVQVFPNIVLPRELDRSERTYVAWNKLNKRDEFDFDTRDAYRSICKRPVLFFLKRIRKDGNITVSLYVRSKRSDDLKRKIVCFPRPTPLPDIDEIEVVGSPLNRNWHLVPRRLCCNINGTRNETLGLTVGQCGRGSLGSVYDSLR